MNKNYMSVCDGNIDEVENILKSIYIVDIEVNGNSVRCYCTDDKEKIVGSWGDDWNDKPYEHNAGTVYEEYYDYYIDLFFPFDYSVLTPADDWHYSGNSPYCKNDFKQRYAPAVIICDTDVEETGSIDITYSKYFGADSEHVIKLYYGDSLFKFINKAVFFDFDVVDK